MTDRKRLIDTRRMAAILHLTAAVLFAASPLMVGGFNGFAPDQFPVPQTNVPVQPAGYAFSIWGVIYLWLIAGAGYGLLVRSDSGDWAAMRWPLIGSLVIGAAWIPAAQASVPVATVMIWGMWALAVWALGAAGRDDPWWQRAPVALCAGWLTAASCVALGLVLGGYGVVGVVPAALVAICLALALAVGVVRFRPDAPLYPVGVVWALTGVMVSNLDPMQPAIIALAGLGASVIVWQAAKTGAGRSA